MAALLASGITGLVSVGPTGAQASGSGGPHSLAAVQGASTHTRALSAVVSLQLTPPRVTSSAPKPIVGSGEFDFSTGAGRAVLHPPGLTENVVFQPTAIFVREHPRAANALPPGKEWIAAGLTEFPVLSVNFPLFVLQTEASNPSFLLNEVAWGAVSAKAIGTQAVAGGVAAAYQVRVNPSLAASRASGPAGQGFARAVGYELQALGESGATTGSGSVATTVIVWVRSGSIIQLRASPGSGQGTITMTVNSVGNRVQVATPPRSQIVDLATLVPGGERENHGGGDSDGA